MTKELLTKVASIVDATVSWMYNYTPEELTEHIIERWNVPVDSLTQEELTTIIVMLGNMELPFCMPSLIEDGSVELIGGQRQEKYQMGCFGTILFYDGVDEETVREYFDKAITMINKFNQCSLYRIDSDFVIHLTAVLQEDEYRGKFIQFIGDYTETSIEDKWKLIGDSQFVVWADDTKDSTHPGISYGRLDDDYGCHKIAGGYDNYTSAYERLVNNFVGYENGYTIENCGIYHIPTCKTCPFFYLENGINKEKSEHCNECKIVEEAIREILDKEPKVKCFKRNGDKVVCDKIAIHAWSADDHFDEQYYLFDDYTKAKETCDKLNHDEQEANGHDYYCIYYDLEPWYYDKEEK